MSENKPIVEMHGCIVCARIYNILATYTLDGRLVDCTVTSPGGHCVLDERQPLVARQPGQEVFSLEVYQPRCIIFTRPVDGKIYRKVSCYIQDGQWVSFCPPKVT
jgi:hypothetical protein